MEATTNVRQLLQGKGSQVWSVAPDDSVFRALEFMAEKNVGALMVVEGAALVGMFSERDYARKVILHGRASRDTPVRDVMSDRVVTVSPEKTVTDCMVLMTENRIRHLPVVEAERTIGLVSIGDVVKAIISEQSFLIDQLQNYIQGAT
ncbi:MAG TPA: CBS domain-containing protein [Trueperaceae bacterium]|nr:CBS domain-containing protein [Trueperaceae bacterium]